MPQLQLMKLINHNREAFTAASKLWSRISNYLGLSENIFDHFEGQRIKSLISGFHGTDFPLWKLACLLDEEWLEEDVLNAMAELLYFRTAAATGNTAFVYLPTSIFNDARQLYHTVPRVYGPNLANVRRLLSLNSVTKIASSVLHESHFHGFIYDNQEGILKHGDSKHSAPPLDVLPIMAWILVDLHYKLPKNVEEDAINLQGDAGSNGSCAIAAHNFVGYRVTSDVPQWIASAASAFRDQALTELIVYHCCAIDAEVRSVSPSIRYFILMPEL